MDALLTENAIYQTIVENAKDIIVALDSSLHVIAINPAGEAEFKKVFGKELNIGDSILAASAHLPSEQKKILNSLQRALAGESYTLVERYISEQSSPYIYETSYCPIKSSDNQIIGVSSITREIKPTNQTKLNKYQDQQLAKENHSLVTHLNEVRMSEERYKLLIQTTHAIVFKMDTQGKISTSQPSWESYTNQSWEDYKDYGWINAIHLEDRVQFSKDWLVAIDSANIFKSRIRLWSDSDKEYHYVILQALSVLDGQEQIKEWHGSCIDVHKEQQIQHAYEEVATRLDLAVESAQAACWCFNLETHVLHWEGHIHPLFNLQTDDFTQSFEHFLLQVHPADKGYVQDAFEQLKYTNELDIQFRMVWLDDSIHWLEAKGRVQKNKKNVVIGICWNINERMKLEQSRHDQKVALVKASRITTLRESASIIAHELNQPLAAIVTYTKGCLDLLNTTNPLPLLAQPLQKALSQAERAGKILHRVKNFSSRTSFLFKQLDINAFIKETSDIFHDEQHFCEAAIHFELTDKLPLIKADKIELQQVVINLMRNSVEAMRDTKVKNPRITIKTSLQDNWICLAIEDNGPGLTAEQAEKLFQPCYSTKSYGMGLGLAICKSIIERHNGRLTCETLNKGVCFTCLLPIAGKE